MTRRRDVAQHCAEVERLAAEARAALDDMPRVGATPAELDAMRKITLA
jgi:hypothetical protein